MIFSSFEKQISKNYSRNIYPQKSKVTEIRFRISETTLPKATASSSSISFLSPIYFFPSLLNTYETISRWVISVLFIFSRSVTLLIETDRIWSSSSFSQSPMGVSPMSGSSIMLLFDFAGSGFSSSSCSAGIWDQYCLLVWIVLTRDSAIAFFSESEYATSPEVIWERGLKTRFFYSKDRYFFDGTRGFETIFIKDLI